MFIKIFMSLEFTEQSLLMLYFFKNGNKFLGNKIVAESKFGDALQTVGTFPEIEYFGHLIYNVLNVKLAYIMTFNISRWMFNSSLADSALDVCLSIQRAEVIQMEFIHKASLTEQVTRAQPQCICLSYNK